MHRWLAEPDWQGRGEVMKEINVEEVISRWHRYHNRYSFKCQYQKRWTCLGSHWCLAVCLLIVYCTVNASKYINGDIHSACRKGGKSEGKEGKGNVGSLYTPGNRVTGFSAKLVLNMAEHPTLLYSDWATHFLTRIWTQNLCLEANVLLSELKRPGFFSLAVTSWYCRGWGGGNACVW